MGETANIADVALKVSNDIFKHFGWHTHPKKDDNFNCVTDSHKKGDKDAAKTHPTDVVFSYTDPYLGRRVHLLTDLKSYKSTTITANNIRTALKSLGESVECASQSPQWREKFGVIETEPHEVRGLLFVHNHDGQYRKLFYEELRKIKSFSLAPSLVLHFLGPDDIQRLWTIANDILRLKGEGVISGESTFYYPDLVLRRRHGDVWGQEATFESLAGPFMILKHRATGAGVGGYVIYYNRSGSSVEEFEYLLDCFSQYQLLDSEEQLRVRLVHAEPADDFKSRFEAATRKYARAWGFEESRQKVLARIEVERVTTVSANYNPGDFGWR